MHMPLHRLPRSFLLRDGPGRAQLFCVRLLQVVAGAAAEVAQQAGPPRQELIMVASLVDKVPNLAGLARTCEVFG